MRFAPTEDQLAFADAIRGFLSRACPAEAVREAWETGTPPAVWKGLGELGLLTLLAPEELGGGGSELELFAAFDEVGRAAAPGPIVETAAVAVPLLARFAPELLTVETVAAGVSATTTAVMPYACSGAGLLLGEELRLVDLADVERPGPALDDSRAVVSLPDDVLRGASVLASGAEAAAAVATARHRA
ncbi:MAG: acyl-CoA dehydrogenase family protein, partial [Nocardioides sp.]|uniref:acyl-CoA dehydrogenase family protein n=1 Tax=Nocardioides sp. TaxID=35761 RepID=UPI0039E2D395